MELNVVLPFEVLLKKSDVVRLVVETTTGSMGFFPLRLDCVALLVPGILTYEVHGEEEKYVTIDEGILVKTGSLITVSVRNGSVGADLGQLRQASEEDFLKRRAQEKLTKQTLERLELGFLRRFMMETLRG